MAVSRLQTSRRLLGLVSNLKPKATIPSGRKILSLEAGIINLQPTTVHQQFYSTESFIYHEPSVASGLKLHFLPIVTAYQQLEESRQVNVYTDASSIYGFGCVWGNKWARGSWSSECLQKQSCMEVLETNAMIAAMEVWGEQSSGCNVTIHCDNQSVVNRFNWKCKKENKAVQKLFTQMTALAERHNIFLKVVISDTESDLHRGTDGLSKGSLDKFLKYIPDAEATACKIPGHLDFVGRAYVSQQCFKDKLSINNFETTTRCKPNKRKKFGIYVK